MALLPTYPEPHSASPGADYALREQFLHGDLNQIITNQREIWDAIRLLPNIVIEEKQLGDGNWINATVNNHTPAVYDYITHGDTLTTASLLAGDIVSGVAGPYNIVNSSTNPALLQVQIHYTDTGLVFDGAAATIPIAGSFDGQITFPFYWEMAHAGITAIMLWGKAATDAVFTISGVDNGLTHGIYRVTRPT